MILPVVPVVQSHANQRDAVPHTGGHQTATGFVCETGLDTDHRFVHGQQLVGIGQPPFIGRIAEAHLGRSLPTNLPKGFVLQSRRCQQCHITGS